MFRRLEHVPSSYFGKKRINANCMLGPFRASRHMEECEMLKGAFISREDKDAVTETSGKAFLIAQKRVRNLEHELSEGITGQERNFFFRFYPLMMVRDGALIQAMEILQRSNPDISKNRILVTKKNLTCLYAMLAGKKPASIISCSMQTIDMHRSERFGFGKDGLALAGAIDIKSWLVSQSEKTVLDFMGSDVFYRDPVSAAVILGIPGASAEAFASGFDKDSQVLAMLHFDAELDHVLWDSVFVPAVLPDGELPDADVLREWHGCLARAIPEEAMDLLLLESKIKTLMGIAEAVERSKA
jgi:hypothetical protein